jgi:hypothetical protein
LSKVYKEHIEKRISEENRATKEIEQAYILLQIYHNNGSPFKELISEPEVTFRCRIVCIDILLTETLKFIRSLEKSEQILAIMHKFILFRCLPYMSKVTQNKVINTFNDFSHPGGPFFAPRQLRHFALKAMGAMFPEGKEARKLIHNVFRLMHPYYWSQSVAFHSYIYVRDTKDYLATTYNNTLDYLLCRKNHTNSKQQHDDDDDCCEHIKEEHCEHMKEHQ